MKRLIVILLFFLISVIARQAPASGQTTAKAPEPARPRPEGSMVGYIDNAIVGSQLRIRFDSGFDARFPDRAEFFYAKCGCYRALVGSGLPAADPEAPGPQPGVATDLDFKQLYINGEYAPNKRVSFFAEVPIRWLQPKAFGLGFGRYPDQSGIGDIRAGMKFGLVSAGDGRSLSAQFRVTVPSGNASKGMGTDHTSIEPALLYFHPLTDRIALECQFSFWHPIGGARGVATSSESNPEGFAGDILFYGAGPSFLLYQNSRVRFGPVVELAGWHVLNGFQTEWIFPLPIGEKVAGTNIVNLKAGIRTSLGFRDSIYVGYGRALTDAVWYEDIVRFEYRHSF